MQITNEEERHYKALIPYYLAVAKCWFSVEDYAGFMYAVSEPCRLVLKLTAGQKITSGWNYIYKLPVQIRRLRLNQQASRDPAYRRLLLSMQSSFRFIAAVGKKKHTISDYEAGLLRYFEEEYEELKIQAGKELAELNIGANFSEQVLEFFWESIIGERALPLTPTIREILCWDSQNRMAVFDKLLWLIDNPRADEQKYTELKKLAKSMILSYLREYYGTTKKWEELVSDFTKLNMDGLEDADFAELEARQELEYLLSLITNSKDRRVVELALEYEEKGYGTDEVEADLTKRYSELELGLRGFYQRLERMRGKYPELNKRLKPFKKK